VAVGERAEAGGEQDHDRARWDRDQGGLEGREPEELEVELEKDELPVERPVDEEGLQVGECEVAAAEELEGEHRLRHTELNGDEGCESADGERKRPPDVAKALVGTLHQPVRERPEAERRKRCAREVEVADA
jgi:hypothetical protein